MCIRQLVFWSEAIWGFVKGEGQHWIFVWFEDNDHFFEIYFSRGLCNQASTMTSSQNQKRNFSS